jgi:ribosomal protein S18 acetylase RimI-like enzyme
MSAVVYRPARPGEGALIARMVRQLALDIGATTVPQVTGEHVETLAFGPAPVLRLHVAEVDHEPVGCLVGEVIYSTWRGALGLYVCDLHVEAPWRGRGIGVGLLRTARAADLRLKFFKLEVTDDNEAARRFYCRQGFTVLEDERTFVLDGAEFERF